MMKHYTEIPDTNDTEYWEIKIDDGQIRSQTFIPKDKALHQQLKAKAWQVIQEAKAVRQLPRQRKSKKS